jgi:hypothetical protein
MNHKIAAPTKKIAEMIRLSPMLMADGGNKYPLKPGQSHALHPEIAKTMAIVLFIMRWVSTWGHQSQPKQSSVEA